jgi:carboxyl-terminal processing protease
MAPVAATVARMLEQGHYLHPLSLSEKNPPRLESEPPESMSERVLKNYFNILDYTHLYFTKGDIDEFTQRFSPTLAADILHGDLTAPREIFTRFRQRVDDRIAKNKEIAAAPHDFSSNKTVEIDRKKAPWPADLTEADRLWSDRIEAELLQESLNEHPLNPPAKVVTKRYDQFLRGVNEQSDEDVIKTFLVALSQSYDPHSEYMSPSDMENFNIQMRLSLVGIGAVLRTDDGYAKIVEVVPGGPADKDGRLKANDRIAAVAQGKEPFEDVVDMKLDKVVEKIRGGKGTQVRLQVIPANSTDPSKRHVIEITREEVKLKESEAKGEVIELKKASVEQPLTPQVVSVETDSLSPNPDELMFFKKKTRSSFDAKSLRDRMIMKKFRVLSKCQNSQQISQKNSAEKVTRLGWITLPSFYAEMEKHGQGDAKSTTKDVRRILERMKKEGIEGLVIDLRRDGGGSLEEAINLSGLFVGSGPVVQAKDANGKVTVAKDDEGEPFYAGPVVVLANRLSASASEIFAAALQDYGRAVIVGDQRSFGKGTVQTLLDVGKFMPLFHEEGSKAGSLKLTIQKFYRVSGGSTQHRGVLSDIVLPSPTDTPEIGESSLPNPLAYDEVDPQPVNKFSFTSPFIDTLKQHSADRVSKDPEFRYINEDMKRFREKLDLNQLSLNEKVRKEELAQEKVRKEERKKERKLHPVQQPVAYEVTLDTVDKPELPKVTLKKKPAKEKVEKDPDAEDDDADIAATPDPIKNEAIKIIQDLTTDVQSLRTAKTAQSKSS